MSGFLGTIGKAFVGGSGGWIAYAVVAAVIFGAGSYAGESVRGMWDAPALATAQKDTEHQKARYSALWAQIEQATGDLERARADDNAKAATESIRLNGVIVQLQSELAARERARAQASAALVAELNHAPAGDDRDLGPALLHYLDGVRRQQAAAHGPDGGPPSR